MTQEILDLIEGRRIQNIKLKNRYKDLDRTIKQKCKKRKEEWLREKFEEVEQLERVDARLMAEKIREVTGKRSLPEVP